MGRRTFLIAIGYIVGICALAWFSRHDPFFWDTIQLGSKHAHFFFENGLHWQVLPEEIDSGHPPVFGFYLAIIWSFLGKTLLASHIAVFPFLALNAFLLWRLGNRLADPCWAALLPALALLDPVMLGQSVLISPDTVLVTGFLLSLEGAFSAKKWLLALGIALLCIISMRGMMTAGALFTWLIFVQYSILTKLRHWAYTTVPFVPGFLLAGAFLLWHYQATGWIGYHNGSPWATAFQKVGPLGFFRNIAVVGWRWLDFGRVGEILALGWLWVEQKRNRSALFAGDNFVRKSLGALLVILIIFLLPSALLHQNLSAHRYFLPVFLALHFLVFQWIATTITWKRGKILISLILCLAAGNLWVYPRGVSMDWDSTLAHWPYHALRKDAIAYLTENGIDFAAVGSAFPNLSTGEQVLLNGDKRQFSGIDLSENRYVFCSNVFNDISEETYRQLSASWNLIWKQQRGMVWVEIYAQKANGQSN